MLIKMMEWQIRSCRRTRTSYTHNEYADGVVNQPRTWGVGRSELFDHFSSGTKKLLEKEEEVRKPILRRIKMY